MLKVSSQHPTKISKLPLKQEPLELIVNLQTRHTVQLLIQPLHYGNIR